MLKVPNKTGMQLTCKDIKKLQQSFLKLLHDIPSLEILWKHVLLEKRVMCLKKESKDVFMAFLKSDKEATKSVPIKAQDLLKGVALNNLLTSESVSCIYLTRSFAYKPEVQSKWFPFIFNSLMGTLRSESKINNTEIEDAIHSFSSSIPGEYKTAQLDETIRHAYRGILAEVFSYPCEIKVHMKFNIPVVSAIFSEDYFEDFLYQYDDDSAPANILINSLIAGGLELNQYLHEVRWLATSKEDIPTKVLYFNSEISSEKDWVLL